MADEGHVSKMRKFSSLSPPRWCSTQTRSSEFFASSIPSDVFREILLKLPAKSIAAITAVNKYWREECTRLLSAELVTEFSRNDAKTEIEVSLKESFRRLLARPLLPKFFIICCGPYLNLRTVQKAAMAIMGNNIPIITVRGFYVLESDRFECLHDKCFAPMAFVIVAASIPDIKVKKITPLIELKHPHVILSELFKIETKSTSLARIVAFVDEDFDMQPVQRFSSLDLRVDCVFVVSSDDDSERSFYCSGEGSNSSFQLGKKFIVNGTEFSPYYSHNGGNMFNTENSYCQAIALVLERIQGIRCNVLPDDILILSGMYKL